MLATSFRPTLYLRSLCLSLLLSGFLLPTIGFSQAPLQQAARTLTVEDLAKKLPTRFSERLAQQAPSRLSADRETHQEFRYLRKQQSDYLARVNERHLRNRQDALAGAAKTAGASVAANEADSLVLVELFNATSGITWTTSSNWLSGSVASWEGISLNEDGRVIAIVLDANGLSGDLPDAITTLDALQELSLADNLIGGSIPSDIGALTALTRLDLSFNFLTNFIPESVGSLSELTHLILWGNVLTGPIPSTIGDLQKLEELSLFSNSLEGQIPSAIGNLTTLTFLFLDNNILSGTIPTELGQLTNLIQLALDQNQLAGGVPASLGSLSAVQSLFIGDNPLGGSFPEPLLALTQLKALSLARANLAGPISENINQLASLTTLFLDGNLFSGPIPESLNGLTRLTKLNLSSNQLSGEISNNFPLSFQNIVEFILANNQLTGGIPENFSFLPLLQTFDVGGNLLEGEVPSFTFNMDLRNLYLNDNNFSGNLQGQLDLLSLLQRLDLSNNNLEGELPRTIGSFVILEELLLGGNNFSGPLPETMSGLQALELLNLFGNSFSGPLPEFIGTFKELIQLDIGDNAFSGELPESLGEATDLLFLLIDANDFTGAVPASLSNHPNLFGFTCEFNFIESLPDFSGAPLLGSLNVASNRLTFEDLEPLFQLQLFGFNYQPQREVYAIVDNLGNETRYFAPVGGSVNNYQWFRNEEAIAGATNATLMLDNASEAGRMDSITVEVTNAIVSNLIISSVPVRTDGALSRIEISADTLFIEPGDTLQFAAVGFDQFDGTRMFTPTWSATGGMIDADGLYIAGANPGVYDISAANVSGSLAASVQLTIVGAVSTEAPDQISDFALLPNYPNPFSARTQISFTLPTPTAVTLKVFDVLGREVSTVADQPFASGSHQVSLNTSDWPAGVYFYKIKADNFVATRSMIKLE